MGTKKKSDMTSSVESPDIINEFLPIFNAYISFVSRTILKLFKFHFRSVMRAGMTTIFNSLIPVLRGRQLTLIIYVLYTLQVCCIQIHHL
jgi:hypothetical protein